LPRHSRLPRPRVKAMQMGWLRQMHSPMQMGWHSDSQKQMQKRSRTETGIHSAKHWPMRRRLQMGKHSRWSMQKR